MSAATYSYLPLPGTPDAKPGRVHVFELFGPLRGKSGVYGGHRFERGVSRINAASQALPGLLRKMAHYQAYAQGTPDHEAALRLVRQAAVKETRDEEMAPTPPSRAPGRADRAAAPAADHPGALAGDAPPAASPAAGGADPAAVLPGAPAADGDGGRGGALSDLALDGDEQPPTGIPDLIRAAVRGLDPGNPAHWTNAGKPDLGELKARLRFYVTRAQVDEATEQA